MQQLDLGKVLGEKGDAGPAGKSAYEAAQEAGYKGSEEQFAQKLAGNPSAKEVLLADGTNTEDAIAKKLDATGTAVSANKLTTAHSINGVAFDGTADILAPYCNRNILDNPYFVGGGSQQGGGQFPINQRGKTEYTEAAANSYTIDRWFMQEKNATVTLTESGLKISHTANCYLIQRIENWKQLVGKQVTFSVLYADGELCSYSDAIKDVESGANTRYTHKNAYCYTWMHVVDSGKIMSFAIRTDANSDKILAAAKLELGSQQTLAHKENGQWVLNEVPNYAEQLARCQRYQVSLIAPYTTGQAYIVQAIATSATAAYGICPTPVTLAKLATVVSDVSADNKYNAFGIYTTGYASIDCVTSITRYNTMEHGVGLKVVGANFVPGNMYMVYVTKGTTHQFLLDANL